MHIVQLKIDNSIYDNVMFFLDTLKSKGLEIQEDNRQSLTKKQQIKQLLSKSTDIFANIEDPLEWQKKQREEW